MEMINGIKVEVHVALFIMLALWKNYKEKIKAKRDVNNKRKNASNSTQGRKIRLQSDELTVRHKSILEYRTSRVHPVQEFGYYYRWYKTGLFNPLPK